MTMRHRGEGTALWYRAFRYRWLERQIASRHDVRRILDLGCGSGENMWRFVELGRAPIGLDVAFQRLRQARAHGAVVQGTGSALPFADRSLDMVYAAHVLHHVGAHRLLLRDLRRCLRPGGTLFLVESVEDHPLMRLGRALYPEWRGDAVELRLRYRQLIEEVRAAGFDVVEAGQYSVLFWLWEVLPERWAWLDRFTPLFTALEVLLHPLARRWAAHCYCVALPGQ
ncbi:MAG: methyltransferase domain-containing protein, partial [Anaerolineae bacterium]|nr:methyltransferase domain-containing protein [Anaerolineae bacterium]